ncbi:MAG: SPOR domain-containing protein [Candidatus Krumholzibacteriia bacterium]
MRARAGLAIVLVTVALAAAGCSKRAWVAAHGTAGYAEAPAPAVPPPAAAPVVAAAPREAPADPAREGAVALADPGAFVAEQLPWEESAADAPPAPTVGDGAPCTGGPCHWVQIAAPVDSFGCAALLGRADAVLVAAAVPSGGTVRHEGGLWKVQLGPFSRWEEAESARDRLRAAGFAAAWLVRR